MNTLIPVDFETVASSEADASRESSRRLATRRFGDRSNIRIQLLDDDEVAETIAVPASALRLFLHLLVHYTMRFRKFSKR